MKRIVPLSLIVLSLTLAGVACGRGSAQRLASVEPSAAAEDTSEVARMRRLWREKGPKSYRYRYRADCFCYIRDELLITVENGRMTEARKAGNREWVAETFWVAFPTVDELFDQIEEAQRAGTPVSVRYDAALGYPTEATIGTLSNDAGVRHTLRALVPLAPAAAERDA